MNSFRPFGIFVFVAMLFGITSLNSGTVGATGVAIDLGDIVGGGDGSGTGVYNTGINARTGNIAGITWAGNGDTGTSEYDAVPPNPLVDGVFVPRSDNSATTIASTGLTFLFPSTNGLNWDAIRNGVSTLETNQDLNPIYDEGGNVIDVGVGLHANAGITFDLDAIRALHPSLDISSFTGNVGGIPSPTRCGSGTAIAHVLLDGNDVFSAQVGNTIAQSTVFAIPIAQTARFLTLATTDIGSYGCDKAYFGNALLNMVSTAPVGWWPGEGNANDVAGTNDGTLQGGVTFASGMVGQAFSLDGIDDYIDIGSGFDLDSMTLAAWVYIDPATNTGDQRIISKDSNVGIRKTFSLKSTSAAWGAQGKASFQLYVNGVADVVSSPDPLTAGWHHLVGVRDYSTGRFELYDNCVMVAQSTPSISGPIDSTGNTVLGNASPYLVEYFKGLIDEAQIFDRALSAAEIQANCNEPPTADAGGPYLVAAGQDINFVAGPETDDPDGDSLIETWTAAGGTVAGDVYTAGTVPGIYDVVLVVNDGTVDSQPAATMVVVYDPSGGFVTGGGWFDSPAGAFKADPSLTGKANFGFVAKYKKGATVPDGNTQFQFKAGDLNFHSSSYQWLVVAGNTAQFRGEGTINGQGSYTFMIWADDDSPDTFRIHIWDGNGTVYDNGSQQALGGGNIKIHN